MKGFVRAKDHPCSARGVGKVIDAGTREASVSWFDSPLTEPVVERIAVDNLVPVTLERQTRVYWLDREADTWRVGRVLDADDLRAEVRFANRQDLFLPVADLEVRWDHSIGEPSAFLAAQINESPQFAQARTRFAQSLIAQRGACSGMSGLISSVIDLEQHQYEVVKRVLQDPVQRYLLADEVGLGKTIEAGVLIRQYALDDPDHHQIRVIVPPALVVQWRRELRKRFLLGDLLDESLHVIPANAGPEQLVDALRGAGMVVIDEAHYLSRDRDLYDRLREWIIAAPRLLLLSATPVVHNERGFLEMLHLLDPGVYRLDRAAEFKQRIEHRQALAESVAGLIPENLLQIEDFIDDLTQRFPDDSLLSQHADSLRNIVLGFPDESDPEFIEATTKLRAHLTETYRLDRRILRNRRRDLPFLTPDRAGVESVDYSSPEVSRLIQAVEAWRSRAAGEVYANEDSQYAHSLAQWFALLLETVLVDPPQVAALVRDRLQDLPNAPTGVHWEHELLVELEGVAKQQWADRERLTALITLIDRHLQDGKKVVVFSTNARVADVVSETLQRTLSEPVDRHVRNNDPENDYIEQDWEYFLSAATPRVLVCDAEAEEGLNLQGGAKVIVHFDLPLAPNRVEQRLGRADRYGSGDAVRSFALCCTDDPYARAWLTYLDQGLRLFDRSVASLQYLIDEEMQSLAQALLIEGVDALQALSDRTGGKDGTAERELRRIDDQDALDALTLPDEEAQFDSLTDVDSNWRDIAESVTQWMIDILQIEEETAATARPASFGFGAFRFCFSYQDRGSGTLIPLKRILSALMQLLDVDARGAHSKLLKTGWYTCRRDTAIGASAPADGIRLVRWGETLVERIQQITDLDDRGRAAAMWRQHRNYHLRSDGPADLFLRFDFIVEVDIAKALREIGDHVDSVRKAISRRGDMAFAPFYKTIWVDEELSVVTNPDVLEVLEAHYQRAPNDGSHQDWNINSDRWPSVNGLDMPVVKAWRQWIPEARDMAEQLLRKETALEQLCREAIERFRESDEGRFAQLRVRIQHADPETAREITALLAREERIAKSLYTAIREPRITLGTVLAVFVSPYALPGLASAHG
ncbi:MAG: protein DpdE [Pseudomonadales bacterium]